MHNERVSHCHVEHGRDIWILTKLGLRSQPDLSTRLRLGRDDRVAVEPALSEIERGRNDRAFHGANQKMYPLWGRRNPLIRKCVNVPNYPLFRAVMSRVEIFPAKSLREH